MTEREAEDWLIRYLVVLVVSVTAGLAFLYGIVFMGDLLIPALSLVVLAAIGVLVGMDLRSWRGTDDSDRVDQAERPRGS